MTEHDNVTFRRWTAADLEPVLLSYGVYIASREARRRLAETLASDGCAPDDIRKLGDEMEMREGKGVDCAGAVLAKTLTGDWRTMLADLTEHATDRDQRRRERETPRNARDDGMERTRQENTEHMHNSTAAALGITPLEHKWLRWYGDIVSWVRSGHSWQTIGQPYPQGLGATPEQIKAALRVYPDGAPVAVSTFAQSDPAKLGKPTAALREFLRELHAKSPEPVADVAQDGEAARRMRSMGGGR